MTVHDRLIAVEILTEEVNKTMDKYGLTLEEAIEVVKDAYENMPQSPEYTDEDIDRIYQGYKKSLEKLNKDKRWR